MRHGSLIALAVFLAQSACEQPADRPPPLPCAGCGTRNIGISGGYLPPSDMDGGTAGSGSDEPVRLEGEVRILNDIADYTSTLFAESAALRVEGTNGDVLGQWNGLEPFSIEGVKRAGTVWAQTTPTPGDVLRALAPVNTSSPNDAGVVTTLLRVARASDIEEAFDLLTSPIVRNTSAAQAIIIALRNGAPVSGTRVVTPRDVPILYVENGVFSDTATSTDGSGIFMVANVPAGDWPGSTVALTLEGSVAGRFDLLLVSGGVTLAPVGN